MWETIIGGTALLVIGSIGKLLWMTYIKIQNMDKRLLKIETVLDKDRTIGFKLEERDEEGNGHGYLD